MKILVLGDDSDTTKEEIEETINDLPVQERGIVIIGGSFEIARVMAMQLAHTLQEMPIIFIDKNEQNALSGPGSLRELDEKITRDMQLQIIHMRGNMESYNHITSQEIIDKKQQEKWRRKHFSNKITKKGKGR